MEEKLSHLGLGMPSGDDNVKHLAVFCVVGKLPANNSAHYLHYKISFSPLQKKRREKKFQWRTKAREERGWNVVSESEKGTAPLAHTRFAASHLSAAENSSPLIIAEHSFHNVLVLLFYLTAWFKPVGICSLTGCVLEDISEFLCLLR